MYTKSPDCKRETKFKKRLLIYIILEKQDVKTVLCDDIDILT